MMRLCCLSLSFKPEFAAKQMDDLKSTMGVKLDDAFFGAPAPAPGAPPAAGPAGGK